MNITKICRKSIPKCHDCVHFQYGLPTYSKKQLDYSYGKCNRIYTRNSPKLVYEHLRSTVINSTETYFSPPAIIARQYSDLCGNEGKFFINKINYSNHYYSFSTSSSS